MQLTITINMENAAFEPRPAHEALRILREARPKITKAIFEAGFEVLLDVNGNKVGEIEVTE